MAKAKRKATSKRLRFEIFARDAFTCVYCGRQPPEVRLVLEHVILVCQGGTTDDMNLKTSCEACNQGKGPRLIIDCVPTENARMAEAQELMETRHQLDELRKCVQAKDDIEQTLTNRMCDLLGVQSIDKKTVSTLANLVSEFGAVKVDEWMKYATRKCYKEINTIKYICGIARAVRATPNIGACK